MLAYVFWHWPRPHPAHPEPLEGRAGTGLDRYAEALLAFHRSLRDHPPTGFQGSRVREVAGLPWVRAACGLEDWYFVDDWTALGALEQAAVSGPRRAPHDRAARLAEGGAGGVYERLREGAQDAPEVVTWFAKPAGVPYPPFLAGAPPGELWQRKLVLGPAPEFCLAGPAAPPGADEPLTVGVRTLG